MDKDILKVCVTTIMWGILTAIMFEFVSSPYISFIMWILMNIAFVFYALYDEQKEKTNKQKKLKNKIFSEFMKNR